MVLLPAALRPPFEQISRPRLERWRRTVHRQREGPRSPNQSAISRHVDGRPEAGPSVRARRHQLCCLHPPLALSPLEDVGRPVAIPAGRADQRARARQGDGLSEPIPRGWERQRQMCGQLPGAIDSLEDVGTTASLLRLGRTHQHHVTLDGDRHPEPISDLCIWRRHDRMLLPAIEL